MSILGGLITGEVAGSIIGRIANPILKRVAEKVGAGPVIEAIAGQAGVEPVAVPDLAKKDPEAFARAVEAAASAESARWATLLAETSSPSVFVAGARPAALWACVVLLVWAGVGVGVLNWLMQLVGLVPGVPVLPALAAPPAIIWETLVWLLPLLYGIRAGEGFFGVKRSFL